MVWKMDLAKLKEELKKEGAPPSRPPQPKPVPKPAGPLDLGGEDAMFLAAMGLRPAPVHLQDRILAPEPQKSAEEPKAPPIEEGFLEVMTSLKGLKRTKPAVPITAEPPVQAPVPIEPVAKPDLLPKPQEADSKETERPLLIEPSSPELQKREPILIQLAAGMAIEVDGVLDLRGHSRADTLERLKERVLDGQVLGWRTCHVLLGGSVDLAQAFKEFLSSAEAAPVARYAQAPIPMGGAQAWILYYAGPGTIAKENP